MLSRWARTWSGKALGPLLWLAARAGLTPNGLTALSLLCSWAAGGALALGRFPLGAGFILLGGLCDSLDGELARRSGQATPLGAFLDSIADHYGDFGVYLGLAGYYLTHPGQAEILLILAALFGSLAGSQIRSRAGMVGIDTRWSGLFTRAERTLVLAAGLLVGQALLALAILALMNNLSALQRLWVVVRESKDEG